MAVVDAVSDTGIRFNGRPVTELRLLVEQAGREPYPVIRRAVLPDVDGSAGVGRRRIPVLVDPERRENVLLRWDLPAAD
jgi:hypothetical protein